MPEVAQSSVRIQRVHPNRGNIEVLQCPLDPELLVAELAGELPPNVAQAVREHLADCAICGPRSRALRGPYDLLASLGREPVPYVPDLRDVVRGDAARGRILRGVGHFAGAIGRGGALAAAAVVGITALVAIILVSVLGAAGAQTVTRSANSLVKVPAAAPRGHLFTQTDKLVTVVDNAGHQWSVAEILSVDERTGAVTRSLPSAEGALRTAGNADASAAVAVSPDGTTIFELTATTASHQQALVAVNASTGAIRYAAPLALSSDTAAVALALAPDGSTVYVGLDVPVLGQPRALALDAASGAPTAELAPGLDTSIPLPPPPGSLPTSVFPGETPRLDAGGMRVALGSGGALALSPDGQWLFDVLLLQSAKGDRYAVIRRFSVTDGQEAQALALPGDFTLARLTSGGTADAPRVALVKGSPDAQAFVLDAGTTGPTLSGEIALGGPAAPQNVSFTGTLQASLTADGLRLYITQDASAAGGRFAGHDLWVVDAQGMSMLAHRVDADAASDVLANAAGGPQARIFVLRGGQVLLISPDLTGATIPWLSLRDGHPVIRLLASV